MSSRACLSRVRRFLALALLGILAACATPKDAGPPMIETQLYFGMARADTTVITESDWLYFVKTEIAPRFPKGMTVVNGVGQWTPPEGTVPVQEPSKVVLIVHPDNPREERYLLEVIELYKRLFQQAAVFRVDLPVKARTQ